MKKIKVISLQMTPQKHAAMKNCDKVEEIISSSRENYFDLIVLPEFFNTGINYKNNEYINCAEKEHDSLVLHRMSKIAQNYSSYLLAGSILINEENKLYNRSYLLDRQGQIVAKYDKINLFKYMGGQEHTYTTSGAQYCVVKTDFANIGLATCFDLRYPSHFSKLVQMGAEIITLPAAWSIAKSAPDDYKEQFVKNWTSMCVARALDNVAYFISANNVGPIHPMFTGIGDSAIIDYNGKIIAKADETSETYITSEFDLSGLERYRKSFPVHTFTI